MENFNAIRIKINYYIVIILYSFHIVLFSIKKLNSGDLHELPMIEDNASVIHDDDTPQPMELGDMDDTNQIIQLDTSNMVGDVSMNWIKIFCKFTSAYFIFYYLGSCL